MSNLLTNSNADLRNLESLLESPANQQGRIVWRPASSYSTDWNVSLSPAPSGNRSRILFLLFLIAQEDFLGSGFGQWTRWTRSRIHEGGTTRTPYSSFAALTRWVSSTLNSFFFLPFRQGCSELSNGKVWKYSEIVSLCCFWRLRLAHLYSSGKKLVDWIISCVSYAWILATGHPCEI